MAELIGTEVDGIQSLRNELTEIGRSLRSSFRARASSFRSTSNLSSAKDDVNEEYYIHWAAIEKLPTFERMRKSVLHKDGHGGVGVVVDVAELGAEDRQFLMEKLIKHAEKDNLKLLQKIRDRTERVGVKLPAIEVRYKNLCVEADCQIVHGNPLPTVWNFPKNSISGCSNFLCSRGNKARISIIDGVSGIIKPGRMTLLLGPPGCGKTTFLKALSGNLHEPLKLSGEVSYNGYKLGEFVSQKTSAYISQYDLHLPQMTVRETLDFSAQCQGVGSREEIMMDVSRREKEAGIIPDPDVDTYMKGVAVKGLKKTLQTDYILKILGLEICADTLVGDAMRRGISGGQKKRLTTGEMVVGPNRALFMDEITNGLDSTTAFQVVACLQHHARIMDATILVTLLQPAPETFDLFDELILMAEGKVIYHGPRDQALKFFEDCGLKCPERKGAASFLQEVISRKDQAQYWSRPDVPYSYIPVNTLAKRFKESSNGMRLEDELLNSYDKSQCHSNALSFSPSSSLSRLQLLKACMSRELLLMRRNSFLYTFKTCQLIMNASVMMTVFIRTQMSIDTIHANYYMGALYYAIVIHTVAGLSEMGMTLSRLAVFYKQKELRFYPAWAYAISTCILKVPVSLLQSVVWTSLAYYVVGYTPEAGRFFRQLIILFAMNMSSTSMFRFIASVSQTHVVSGTAAAFSILLLYSFGGFLIAKPSMPGWLSWGFWLSPGTYTQIGLSLNEFLAPRWQKMLQTNSTIGHQTLQSRGLDFGGQMFWVSVGALFGFALLFDFGFVLALTFLKAPGKSRAIISHENYIRRRGAAVDSNDIDTKYEKAYQGRSEATNPRKDRVVLPFAPLTLMFENVHYYIDTPPALPEQGFTQKRFQLLSGITGAFRPGILTALMGVTGAGKTTLLDVLSGRKTVGYIEGAIKVGGYPKVQDTFSRISGYCEQTDVHSPQITVEESIIFSAGMRLDTRIDSKIRSEFVNEVLEITELDRIKDTLVGVPGVSGLSMEQRKRLTIAVELVANPSIIFMDEPTTGLDARAAAIIMRAVKNVADTGRTIVCTIHQPSIDIFDSFNELVLLKSGGRIIYSGPVGKHSSCVIEYFESVPGVPKIRENYNPATWMLEVTSESTEAELGVDFAQVYKGSPLYQSNKELVKQLSVPPTGSTDLHFPTRFAQTRWGQLKWCLWKQHWSYWRSPSYIWSRIIQTFVMSFIFGALLWDRGQKLEDQQKLFNILGTLFIQVIFIGIANCSSVLSYVGTERTVMYRERFAGMYNPWAYSLAQVAIEFPYLCLQAALFSAITYPMIRYYGSAYKIFWCFFGVLCSLLIYSCLGMTLVSVTPNLMVAETLQSAFYTNFNLFAGFLVPAPRIPKWWIWVYYLCPTSWTLKALLTSQYGDIQNEIMVFGEKKTVAIFLKDYFGFHHDQLNTTALALVILPIALASIFAISMGRLNFQRR